MRFNLVVILFSCIVIASDQIPAPNQDHPIIISGATIHTVSHGVLENAEILDLGNVEIPTLTTLFGFRIFSTR